MRRYRPVKDVCRSAFPPMYAVELQPNSSSPPTQTEHLNERLTGFGNHNDGDLISGTVAAAAYCEGIEPANGGDQRRFTQCGFSAGGRERTWIGHDGRGLKAPSMRLVHSLCCKSMGASNSND